MPAFHRKYNTGSHVYLPMIKRGVVDFAVGADWTPAAGDVKISKDGGAAANVTNLPVAIAMGNGAIWDYSLTATELAAAKVVVTVADAATKAVEDTAFLVETYGHASAEYQADLSAANLPANATQINGVATTSVTAVNANLGTTQPVNFTGTGASALAKGDVVDIAGAAVATGTAQIGVNVVNFGGAAGTFASGRPEVNATHWGGTAVASANVRADLRLILGTAPTEGGAGRLAGAFTTLLDVASPVLTAASVNQTGDSFARIGAAGAGLTALGDTRIAHLDADVSSRLAPTVAGRTLDVSAGGEAGLDWANVGSPTTTVALTGTTISTGQVVASVSGAVGSVTGAVGSVTGNVGGNVAGSVGSVAAGGIAASSFAAGAIDAAAIATDAIGAAELAASAVAEIQSGLSTLDALGVRNAVGLASANLDAQLSGINAKTTNLPPDPADASDIAFAFAAVPGAVWAAGTRTLTAGTNIVLAKGTGVTGFTDLDAAGIRTAVGMTTANLDTQLDALPTAAESATAVWAAAARTLTASLDPAAATIAAAVWDLATTGHTASGSFGAAMGAAGSAGDPWSTSLPGAYGPGTAGFLVGTNLDAPVSGAGGGGVDKYTLARIRGDSTVNPDGSIDFADVTDTTLNLVRLGPKAAPGGRTVTLDPT
jgi:hypothetical protein